MTEAQNDNLNRQRENLQAATRLRNWMMMNEELPGFVRLEQLYLRRAGTLAGERAIGRQAVAR